MTFSYTSAITACMLWGASCLTAYAAPTDIPAGRGDVVISEFYVPPTTPPGGPGILLRDEPLTRNQSLENASQNIRLLYSSTEGLKAEETTVVSGALYLPEGTPPKGGWPLIVWSHGTVGIGDICAPSFAGRNDRERAYLNLWLANGYAVASSDYQGLGTPGSHPYMNARTMAYNNLDMVRAISADSFPVSKSMVVAGQSQGATAALATGGYATGYTDDVTVSGVIATGIPYFSPEVLKAMAANSNPDAVDDNLALVLYIFTLTEQLNPDFDLDAVVSEAAKPIVDKIGETCVFDLINATKGAGLSLRKTFSQPVENDLAETMSQMQIPGVQFEMPVFAGLGNLDKITPAPMQRAFIKDACEAGSRVSINVYESANHYQALLQSTDDAMVFARAVIAGDVLSGACDVKQ